MIISIQGILGSFHHIAASQLVPHADFLERDNFDDVFDDVRSERAELALVAIENSIAGSLIYNFDRLREYNTTIVGETYLRIIHNLIANPNEELADIKQVWSHPMALQQCRKFLKNYPFQLVEKEDTAAVVKQLSENPQPGIAGVASAKSAELYGMKILAPSIETDPHNYTRFLLIANKDVHLEKPGQTIKTSLNFSFHDGAGQLVKILNLFAALDINMSKLESRPRIGAPWEYEFFADLEFDFRTTLGQELLQRLQGMTLFCRVLGCYPKYQA